MINPKLLFSFLLTVNSTVAMSTLTTPTEVQASYTPNSTQSPVSLRITDFINIEVRPDRRNRRGSTFERRQNDYDASRRGDNDFDSGRDFDFDR